MTALITVLVLALQASSPSEDFEKGKTAFDRGEYSRAIQLLRPLLYPEPRLRTEGEIVRAHRMLAFAHFALRENDAAAQEFRKLLQLRPDFPLDPLIDPPEIVDFFNGVRKEQEKELAELEARRRAAELEERRRLEAARQGPVVIERRYARNSFAIAFVPFGAGQFQNGQRGKGWAFLVGESVLGAVSVGALATNFALYGPRPRIRCVPDTAAPSPPGQVDACPPGWSPGPEQRNSERLTQVQIWSGALFFATAVWGVVDAILHYQPEIQLGEQATSTGHARAGARSPRGWTGLELAPALVGERTVGGSLGFRF